MTEGRELILQFGKVCAKDGLVPAYAVVYPGQNTLAPVCVRLEEVSCFNRGAVLRHSGVSDDAARAIAHDCFRLLGVSG